MYFQSDYILRMIEMMGDFFKRLLENLDEVLKEKDLDLFMRKQCGIDLKTADSLSVDSLLALLPDNPRFVLSETLFIRANAFTLDDEDRNLCLYKACRLLLSVGHENLLCELRKDRLLSLYNDIYGLLTPEDLLETFRFLMLADDMDKAEDVLFDAIETSLGDAKNALIAGGIAAYSSLDKRTDEQEEILKELKHLQDMNV